MEREAEAVIVGSELLLGLGVDTNGAEIGRAMGALGCPLRWKTVVGDSDQDLEEAIGRAASRSAVVIVSGGLGPTEDDRTRFALARVARAELELRPELLAEVEAAFQRMGRPMPLSNRVQALLPAGARVLSNSLGTAPGFWLELGGCAAFALPGVPRELRLMLATQVEPLLRERFGVGGLATRVLKLTGIGESQAGEAVADLMGPGRNPYVGVLASPGEVRFFLAARADDDAAARRLLAAPEAVIRERLGKYVYGADTDTHAAVALDTAAAVGWTVAALEGGTGGELATRLWGAGRPNFAGARVAGAGEFRRRAEPVTSPRETAARLAEQAAREAGASAGLSASLESELVDGGEARRAWLGLWEAGGRTHSRSLEFAFGGDADRLRLVHQAFYELRRFASASLPPDVRSA